MLCFLQACLSRILPAAQKFLLRVSFSTSQLHNHAQNNNLWLYFGGPLCLYVNMADSLATFSRYWSNFWPVEKSVRALRSHGTVQYFCAVHIELSNRIEIFPKKASNNGDSYIHVRSITGKNGEIPTWIIIGKHLK